MNQAEIRCVICSSDKLANLINLKKLGKLPLMKTVVFFDEALPEDIKNA